MDKTNQKRANKPPKTKKQQPLKVVYIANPIKFNAASASEFRALVQELTGQDADAAPETAGVVVADGGGVCGEEVANAAEDDVTGHVHARIGQKDPSWEVGRNGSGPASFGSGRDGCAADDGCYASQMVEGFEGLWSEGANLDVFKNLDAM